MTTSLQVGVATGDITPERGIHMGGYWGRMSGATDIHDRLLVRALVATSGHRMVGLLVFDLIALDASTVAQLREAVAADRGMDPEAMMVCCTHTHSGPLTYPFRGMGQIDMAYLDYLLAAGIDVVRRAADTVRSVFLSYNRVPVQIGLNRRQERDGNVIIGRNPSGAVAPYAHVVGLTEPGGELLGSLFSHACHPVVLGNANYSISGDFAGAACRYVEAHSGAPAIFVNGACGDINPRVHPGEHATVQCLGAELGRAVILGLQSSKEITNGAGVSCIKKCLRLPLIDPPPRLRMEVDRLRLKLKAEIRAFAHREGDRWTSMVPRARLDWSEAMLARSRPPCEVRYQTFEVHGVRIGDLLLLGLEGEIFVRYQLDIEATAPRGSTIVCGYANGCIGYVPTADEYLLGGYEVEEAYKVYKSVQMIAPESDRMIRNCAGEVLTALCSGCGAS